jgi:hypothetical protein
MNAALLHRLRNRYALTETQALLIWVLHYGGSND